MKSKMSEAISEADISAWQAETYSIYAIRTIQSIPGSRSPLVDILKLDVSLLGRYRVLFRDETRYHGSDRGAAVEVFNDILARGGR